MFIGGIIIYVGSWVRGGDLQPASSRLHIFHKELYFQSLPDSMVKPQTGGGVGKQKIILSATMIVPCSETTKHVTKAKANNPLTPFHQTCHILFTKF